VAKKLVNAIGIVAFSSMGLVEVYLYFEGYFVAGVLLDMTNNYITHCIVEDRRWR
jgi:hypothetical protein